MKRSKITAVGGYIPSYILTNKELEKNLDTNNEWIIERTGIKERRLAKELSTSDLAVEAIKDMVKRKNIDLEEIDMVICVTVTPEMCFPATANIICNKLGIKKKVSCFDANAACGGFILGLMLGNSLIISQNLKKILVVGSDKMSKVVDFNDRNTAILFGDGAGCVLLEGTNEDEGIIDVDYVSDNDGVNFLFQNQKGFVQQEGKVVFRYAVKSMAESVERIKIKNNIVNKDINWVVPHQANIRIIQTLGQYLEVDPNKITVNIDKYGNTTDATIPLCLSDFEKKFKKGDNLILTAFGGGFTCGSILLKWAY